MTAQEAALLATDFSSYYTVTAMDRGAHEQVELFYRLTGQAGHGSFGVVAKAELLGAATGVVALKRTRQDRRFKNRELQIMCAVDHPNIVKLRYFWYEASDDSDDDRDSIYLHLVLEFVPDTLYRTYRSFAKRRERMPELLVKLYLFQLLRALNYLHSVGICHRDIKPHNVMVDPDTGRVVLIDFGSAKVLSPGEPNVAYTCSRYYRAPELIFGATQYSNSIDLWATGCILGECLAGKVFFPGTSGVDQLVEIIKVLGTPTLDEVQAMNPSYTTHRFPQVEPVSIKELHPHASQAGIDLLAAILVFTPALRPSAVEAMCHPFFNDLRTGNLYPLGAKRSQASSAKLEVDGGKWGLVMPNGNTVKVPLFNFTAHELSVRPDLVNTLVPPHARDALLAGPEGIDVERFEPIDLEPLRVHLD